MVCVVSANLNDENIGALIASVLDGEGIEVQQRYDARGGVGGGVGGYVAAPAMPMLVTPMPSVSTATAPTALVRRMGSIWTLPLKVNRCGTDASSSRAHLRNLDRGIR